MDEAGYTRSYRRRWTHPAFRNLRDAAIWSWMTDSAAWRDTAVRFCGQKIEIKRGQLVTSERFLADGFCVDRQVIRRLLDNLVSEHMVSLKKTHDGTIITICNYDKYQASFEIEEPSDQPPETHGEPTTNPNKKELKKPKEYKFKGKTIRLTAEDYDRWRASFFAITDFDAELTRIDATVEGRAWFSTAAAKLNYKHQELLRAKAERATPADSGVDLQAIAKLIRRSMAEGNRVWVSKVSRSLAKQALDAGIINAGEAAYCGYRAGDNVSRGASEAA